MTAQFAALITPSKESKSRDNLLYYPRVARSVLHVIQHLGLLLPIPHRLKSISLGLYEALTPAATTNPEVESQESWEEERVATAATTDAQREFQQFQVPYLYALPQKSSRFRELPYGSYINLPILLWLVHDMVQVGCLSITRKDNLGDNPQNSWSNFVPNYNVPGAGNDKPKGVTGVKLHNLVSIMLYQRNVFPSAERVDQHDSKAIMAAVDRYFLSMRKWTGKAEMYSSMMSLYIPARKEPAPLLFSGGAGPHPLPSSSKDVSAAQSPFLEPPLAEGCSVQAGRSPVTTTPNNESRLLEDEGSKDASVRMSSTGKRFSTRMREKPRRFSEEKQFASPTSGQKRKAATTPMSSSGDVPSMKDKEEATKNEKKEEAEHVYKGIFGKITPQVIDLTEDPDYPEEDEDDSSLLEFKDEKSGSTVQFENVEAWKFFMKMLTVRERLSIHFKQMSRAAEMITELQDVVTYDYAKQVVEIAWRDSRSLVSDVEVVGPPTEDNGEDPSSATGRTDDDVFESRSALPQPPPAIPQTPQPHPTSPHGTTDDTYLGSLHGRLCTSIMRDFPIFFIPYMQSYKRFI